MRIFHKELFYVYFIIFTSYIICDDEYLVNLDGENCSNAPENPEIADECTSYHTEETACCFAEIETINRDKIHKCVEVPRDARFALNSLTILTLKDNKGIEYEDVIAKFQCGQTDKSCGMDVPDKIFQCSEHSSTSRSCCFLKTPTYTECVLSDKKYDQEVEFKLFEESTVYCSENFNNKNIIIIMAFFIIINIIL